MSSPFFLFFPPSRLTVHQYSCRCENKRGRCIYRTKLECWIVFKLLSRRILHWAFRVNPITFSCQIFVACLVKIFQVCKREKPQLLLFGLNSLSYNGCLCVGAFWGETFKIFVFWVSGIGKSEGWLSYLNESYSVSSFLDGAVGGCFLTILLWELPKPTFFLVKRWHVEEFNYVISTAVASLVTLYVVFL